MSTLKHLVHHRPRLLIGMAVGILLWMFLPESWKWVTRVLVAWNVGVGFYLVLIVGLMLRATHEQIRGLAEEEDSSHLLVIAVVLVAALMSFCAIVLDLAGVKGLAHSLQMWHYALAGLTIVASWFLTGVMFTLSYARLYYRSESRPLDFPVGEHYPTYWDFLYFSFSIACAAATSDTNVTAQSMRKVVLIHSIISFFFNLAIFGLSINLAAGVLAG
ncbi:MAG: hypothetical protein H6R05_889 [Burkholderiaceae bacterium]|nr:hypothetical protein [Burkholderiaceae bacterium]